MTPEEAKKFWEYRYNLSKDYNDPHWEMQELREHRDYVSAMRLSIKAMEKQIPIKPITRTIDRGFNLPMPTKVTVCPICGVGTPIPRNLEVWESWCPDCGQKLDWSLNDIRRSN